MKLKRSSNFHAAKVEKGKLGITSERGQCQLVAKLVSQLHSQVLARARSSACGSIQYGMSKQAAFTRAAGGSSSRRLCNKGSYGIRKGACMGSTTTLFPRRCGNTCPLLLRVQEQLVASS